MRERWLGVCVLMQEGWLCAYVVCDMIIHDVKFIMHCTAW